MTTYAQRFERRTRMLAVGLVMVAITTAVFAHMKATRSEPAANATLSTPPTRIAIWFTQAPDPKVSRLQLAGPGGPVKLSTPAAGAENSVYAAVQDSLANGRYTVHWQSAGDDGHLQKGVFSFTVQRATD